MLQQKDLPAALGTAQLRRSRRHASSSAPTGRKSPDRNTSNRAIARTLTGDIYRADDRAINSVNREIFAQQQILAERIRSIRSQAVLAHAPSLPGLPTPVR